MFTAKRRRYSGLGIVVRPRHALNNRDTELTFPDDLEDSFQQGALPKTNSRKDKTTVTRTSDENDRTRATRTSVESADFITQRSSKSDYLPRCQISKPIRSQEAEYFSSYDNGVPDNDVSDVVLAAASDIDLVYQEFDTEWSGELSAKNAGEKSDISVLPKHTNLINSSAVSVSKQLLSDKGVVETHTSHGDGDTRGVSTPVNGSEQIYEQTISQAPGTACVAMQRGKSSVVESPDGKCKAETSGGWLTAYRPDQVTHPVRTILRLKPGDMDLEDTRSEPVFYDVVMESGQEHADIKEGSRDDPNDIKNDTESAAIVCVLENGDQIVPQRSQWNISVGISTSDSEEMLSPTQREENEAGLERHNKLGVRCLKYNSKLNAEMRERSCSNMVGKQDSAETDSDIIPTSQQASTCQLKLNVNCLGNSASSKMIRIDKTSSTADDSQRPALSDGRVKQLSTGERRPSDFTVGVNIGSGTEERCAEERCAEERCAGERCAEERCAEERCAGERCAGDRCEVSPYCEGNEEPGCDGRGLHVTVESDDDDSIVPPSLYSDRGKGSTPDVPGLADFLN